MKIKSIHLENFMLFDTLDIEWSAGINIISGGNSTGKTTLMKALYSILKPIVETNNQNISIDNKIESAVVEKLLGCFRPEGMKIGRLVSRQRGNNASASLVVNTDMDASISAQFSNRQDKHITLSTRNITYSSFGEPVYIPPKEMISATEHFQSLYEDYHIDFEEMYYDLTKLLSRPLKKGAASAQQRYIMQSFEKILNGRITQQDKKFFLQLKGKGRFEMGLLSEGYRKLATIIYLIQSGSLDENTVLFWDEPETNMNPAMIPHLSDAVMKLAETGVQIFITTHDYFVQQAFNMYNAYPKLKKQEIDIKFISLYHDEESKIIYETADTVAELEHNPIMEEFNNIYDRELRYIDGDF